VVVPGLSDSCLMELATWGRRWAIASPHTAATRAGAAAFAAGGNAIDAALAASITLAVTYPQACGIGGDLFAVVDRAGHDGGETLAVIAAGRAPAAADPDAVRREHGDRMPLRGPHPVTVPGAAAGWETLHRMGARLEWSSHFAVGTAAAFDGIPTARGLAATLADPDERPVFEADAGLRAVFYPDDAPLARGDLVFQPALGATLEAVAAGGAEALYRGPVGAAYVEGLRAAGSPITTEDLARHEPAIVPPLRAAWRGLHLSVAPPPSPGLSLLQILTLGERLGLAPDPSGPDAATWARVFLAAERDVARHLADPDRMAVHVSTLLDDGHLAALTDEVEGPLVPGRATVKPGGDTIAVVAADAEGHAVSLIQSLFNGFGAGILEPRTGIVAHDRGACFTLDAALPSCFAPGAQPPHTLLPVVVHDEDRLVGVAGTMGGYQQPQIDAQTIANAFARGADPGEAVAAPRFVVDDLPADGGVPRVAAEASVPADAVAAIEDAGFAVQRFDDLDGEVGHAHLIALHADGRLHVGSDPRADGGAMAD